MQLTQYTDYSLRVLIYLAKKTEDLSTVSEIAEYHGISRNHLVKVIHNLALKGFILTTRGRNGGMRLSRPPSKIILGDVIRNTEPNFDIAECFNATNNCCVITHNCGLKSIFHEAQMGFIKAMDKYTLADAVARDNLMSKPISLPFPARSGQPCKNNAL
ncbi:MAG: Rrf2 family transcriptional regulator [Betaproteobacteria bacterium]|nr:Rrf2 family transcriptional regulator [Betaproteobacteria bacterium]